jgi:hypothetical protein
MATTILPYRELLSTVLTCNTGNTPSAPGCAHALSYNDTRPVTTWQIQCSHGDHVRTRLQAASHHSAMGGGKREHEWTRQARSTWTTRSE